MNKQEVKRKFDEIVDFAGVEQFIDTPVKRYSSGMYVRLAFAVAAHWIRKFSSWMKCWRSGMLTFCKSCIGKMDEMLSTKKENDLLCKSRNGVR
jgi:lipopolysaccharide transport system ATP-binding protein